MRATLTKVGSSYLFESRSRGSSPPQFQQRQILVGSIAGVRLRSSHGLDTMEGDRECRPGRTLARVKDAEGGYALLFLTDRLP